MKISLMKEYFRRERKLLQSKLGGINVMGCLELSPKVHVLSKFYRMDPRRVEIIGQKNTENTNYAWGAPSKG